MDSPSRGYHPPDVPDYDDEPPAYSFTYGDSAPLIAENESTPTAAAPRMQGSTMRLLPTNVDVHENEHEHEPVYEDPDPDAMNYENYDTYDTYSQYPSHYDEYEHTQDYYPESIAYVHLPKPSSAALVRENSLNCPSCVASVSGCGDGCSEAGCEDSLSVRRGRSGASLGDGLRSQHDKGFVHHKRPSTPKKSKSFEPKVAVPSPLFTSPLRRKNASDKPPRKEGATSERHTSAEYAAANMPWHGSDSDLTRDVSNPFYHPQDHVPLSRMPSVLDNAPSFPPPTASAGDIPPYSSRPTSPARSFASSQSPDWSTRRPRPPSISTTHYERADLNGSPRPGTPSHRYGGSPRRPLPPAPAPMYTPGAADTSINIDDPVDDDVFGGGGKTINHDYRNSAASFMSDSTIVTEPKDNMTKVDLDEDEYEDDMDSMIDQNQHYGPAPEKQSRRGVRQAQVSKKEVQLINGELILECKIPTILHSFLPRRDDREFTHMRYTAATCDPDDFTHRGYKLRQQFGSTMRETEMLIGITMYNEDEICFTRTMHGVMRNISHLCSRSKSRTWGKDGWKKIVICIMADGRTKVHPRTLNALAALGVYQEGIAKNVVNQKQVKAHVYEYTTQVSLDSDLKFKGAEKGITPCQVILCLKEHNEKKLNSHRWFFNGIGRALQPNICVLLDVGTKPAPTALYHLWKAFDQDSNVAGAAGEIKAGKGKGWLGLLNPLVASQNFEYKMSNILDKPLESVFGYITVLPGALSAYRYYALLNDAEGNGPLNQYFKGETLHGKNADVFTANMYLAEDRILCWELVAKRNERWVLRFVKSAVGETDVPGEFGPARSLCGFSYTNASQIVFLSSFLSGGDG